MQITITVPTLRDHEGYQASLMCLDGLQERLKEARAELCSHDEPGLTGAESHAPEDIDAAIAVHERRIEAARKGRSRCELKIAALERGIEIEGLKIPELHHQAVESVGRVARAQYETVLDEITALRNQGSLLMDRERLIRKELVSAINEQLPGYVAFDLGERFAWPTAGLYTNPLASNRSI